MRTCGSGKRAVMSLAPWASKFGMSREQLAALADYVQAALMLNYNGRKVG